MKNIYNHLKRNLIQPNAFRFSFIKPDNSRIRNFFEVDPIFPDLNEPTREVNPKRLPFHEADDQIRRLQNKYAKAIINPIKFRQEMLRIKEENLKIANNLKKNKKELKKEQEERLVRLAENVLLDSELLLPYGYGFDHYVLKLRQKRLDTNADKFLTALRTVFTKLSYRSDLDLLKWHEYTLGQQMKVDFKDKARAIVLKHCISEIQKMKQGKNGNQGVIDAILPNKDFVKKTLEDKDLNEEDLAAQVDENLSEKIIDNVAHNLATSALQRKITDVQAERKKLGETDLPKRDLNIMDDPFFSDLSEEEDPKLYNERYNPMEYNSKTAFMNDEQFKVYQLLRDAKRRYLKRRNESINRPIEDSKPDIDLHFTQLGPDAEYTFFKKAGDPEDEQIATLQKEVGIKNMPPVFEDILDEVDRIIEFAPYSLKAKDSEDIHTDNTKFKPRFSAEDINPQKLLWGQIDRFFRPVIPKIFIHPPKLLTAKEMMRLKRREKNNPKKIKNTGFIMTNDLFERETPVMLSETKDEDTSLSLMTDLGGDGKNVGVKENEDVLELEIYKRVKQEPFFYHYITNELRYYADRQNEVFNALLNPASNPGLLPSDQYNYRQIKSWKKPNYETLKLETKPRIWNGKAYGRGARKTTVALAYVQEGTGKITVNRREFIEYFSEINKRNTILIPLKLTNMLMNLDVSIFCWGGGISSQATASRRALAHALLRYDPEFKKLLKHFGQLIIDNRQVERKKVGLYKARAKYPYSRR